MVERSTVSLRQGLCLLLYLCFQGTVRIRLVRAFCPLYAHLKEAESLGFFSPNCFFQLLFRANLSFILFLLLHFQVPFPSFMLSSSAIVLPV